MYRSTIEEAVPSGCPTGWPVSIISPLIAWPIGSKPGRSLYGPYCPNAEAESRMMSGFTLQSEA